MERFVVRSTWVFAIAMLAGCSAGAEPAGEAAVAGVVLEREASASDEQAEDDDEADASEPSDPGGQVIGDLALLTSGPVPPGTAWFAAEGGWIGLDGQSLEIGRDDAALRFDALLEAVEGQVGQAAVSCEVHITAPEDAELQAHGTIEGELVVERGSGELERTPLTPLQLDLDLQPGDDHRQVVDVAVDTRDVDAEHDAKVRCEGRFSRT